MDPQGDSAFAYRATFTPTESRPLSGGTLVGGLPGDRRPNNRAAAAVVSRGQRRVLFLDENDPDTGQSQHEHLLATLRRSHICVDRLPRRATAGRQGRTGRLPEQLRLRHPRQRPGRAVTQDQMEMLRSTVYDQGCGLVMVGGPDALRRRRLPGDAGRGGAAGGLRDQGARRRRARAGWC